MGERRVAVTGIGVVAPGGTGTKAFWERITSGRPATRGITAFDPAPFRSRIAAECDFDPLAGGLTEADTERLDRAAQMLMIAAREALADSEPGIGPEEAHRTGVSIGNAVGLTLGLEREYLAVSDGGREWVVDPAAASAHLYDYFVPSSLSAEVAWFAGAEGPNSVVSAGCTSGIDAIGHACALIGEGSADIMITGGADAPIAPITVACFDAIKATSPRNDDAASASRPFDRTRNGFVLGEGAAVLVLEELGRARARGAHVYAEIAGYASHGNAHHMTGLRSDGREMATAITSALDRARLDPTAVDYINAHGTATQQNDRHETAAFKRSLGAHAHAVPVSSIKSVIGHSLGAVGAIEIAACALALEHGVVPPTANLHRPDPELDLDYVPLTARERRLDTVLTVGSGFGGFQSAMVLNHRDRRAA
ncbi:beta-ketoacyl-[acyl-carrier-protein] synthase family protein [Streptomyces virginiae]|uniref:beta-ketoacyl-[acyl-carrier-protein] synthase family protein n=1 Tax=Streptomyces TaxID=1883 RepID=UPI0005278F75|nr:MULTISPECIES: beta-ketoacyl-[acyl-carrier-protein] synthase family protein [Streptomyces]MCX4717910.1 beta-ketoacyl-[acyl-carrier-protein] synthase family protein [Streptomyces virginiae]MCX5277913.1 beta-ketoacyl-[acyl-carrier-protein] synthase family protein [Streptomyces virginiae]MYV80199.1 beta-ketoacyl-ACP synthase II [Streptomyces sp. SID1046]